MKTALNLLVCALLGISLSACAGYRLGNIKGENMQSVNKIYVPVVKNETYVPSLNVLVTNAIIDRMEADGTYTSSRSRGADAILEARIVKIDRKRLRSDRTAVGTPIQYELDMEVEVTLVNLVTGTKIFDKREFHGKTEFYLFENAKEAERQAYALVAQDLADEIISSITDGAW